MIIEVPNKIYSVKSCIFWQKHKSQNSEGSRGQLPAIRGGQGVHKVNKRDWRNK